MKLGTLKNGCAVLIKDQTYIPLSKLGFIGPLKNLFYASAAELGELQRAAHAAGGFTQLSYDELDAPYYDPAKIVAIGLNYIDHAAESKMQVPTHPLVFTKFSSSITGPYNDIIIPTGITTQVDYEVELGVIIGKYAKNVTEEEALDYVFGYTVLNDVSARDIQFADGQWVRGKSLDTFCPYGPWIITADEIKDPTNLDLSLTLNGQVLQSANTCDMIFSVAKAISLLSRSFTFEPGDLIATGTPSGVGFTRKPPIYLNDKDVMITEVKQIGKLINRIKAI